MAGVVVAVNGRPTWSTSETSISSTPPGVAPAALSQPQSNNPNLSLGLVPTSGDAMVPAVASTGSAMAEPTLITTWPDVMGARAWSGIWTVT